MHKFTYFFSWTIYFVGLDKKLMKDNDKIMIMSKIYSLYWQSLITCWCKLHDIAMYKIQHHNWQNTMLQYRVMVFNATFNKISVVSLQSVLLVEETRVTRENNQSVASHWQTLSHKIVWNTPCHERDSNS
jgi:hypothetical protein